MSKGSLYILPIQNIIFPYQSVRLVIPENSLFFGKNLLNTFIGISPLIESDASLAKTPSNNQEKTSHYGTVIKVTQEMYMQGNLIEKEVKIITGLSLKRYKILNTSAVFPFKLANVEFLNDEVTKEKLNILTAEGLVKQLKDLGVKYVETNSRSPSQADSRKDAIAKEDNIVKLCYDLATYLEIPREEKIKILEFNDLEARMKELIKHLKTLTDLSEVSREIDEKARKSLSQENRKALLKRKQQEINKELYGTPEDENATMEKLIQDSKLPEKVQEIAMQELKRLRSTPNFHPEYMGIKKYLDTIVGLPWSKSSPEFTDIARAEEILNRDHSGLDKVKRRILEFLAVKILKKNSKGTILCLQGPPGVGKTSLGRSIADALGRKFERVSLGGVRDEAEIRGHRRTYIGALPGVFIQALLRCKTNNPVILLDEIDKVSRSNYTGDPSSALLEVLDPNQNSTFVDHFLGLPFDLSNILFIGTANTLETLQAALLDRLEVITLPGYTQYEKVTIAENFLIPKQIEENGIEKSLITFPKEAIEMIIRAYTKEAGVRSLERIVGSLCRNVAFKYLKEIKSQEGKQDGQGEQGQTSPHVSNTIVTAEIINSVLGPVYFDDSDLSDRLSEPGIAVGLAWTSVGGKILLIEASKSSGKGKLEITGKLGDVMKESVRTAIGWIKSNMDYLTYSFGQFGDRKREIKDIEADSVKHLNHVFDTIDMHIHFPAAAIPKDGPSAGITIAIALISMLSDRKVKSDIAMTGEVSLKGVVLPVGGIKEKCIAAYEAGIRNIILPEKNRKDVEEISKEIQENLKFYFVKHITEVIKLAIEKENGGSELLPIDSISMKDMNKISKL
jgi:ATP-dependent Lon protease